MIVLLLILGFFAVVMLKVSVTGGQNTPTEKFTPKQRLYMFLFSLIIFIMLFFLFSGGVDFSRSHYNEYDEPTLH